MASPWHRLYPEIYGRGDAFQAVRLIYVMASDDKYTKTNFWPSNENLMMCGLLASVECSVSGAFYKELPCVRHLTMPSNDIIVFDKQMSMEVKSRPCCSTALSSVGDIIGIRDDSIRNSMWFAITNHSVLFSSFKKECGSRLLVPVAVV
jgi:hypothetical protein